MYCIKVSLFFPEIRKRIEPDLRHPGGEFLRRPQHVVACSADQGTTYGMRQGKAASQRTLFPGGGACYASGKVTNEEENGSGAEGDAVIAVREYKHAYRFARY